MQLGFGRGLQITQAPLQEPWDGPAAMVFSDGVTVGAKLDRNGLRPLRYTLTSDGLLVVGSEVGIADFHGREIVERQRLGPGEMLLCNPRTGESVAVIDKIIPFFKTGKQLRERLNAE